MRSSLDGWSELVDDAYVRLQEYEFAAEKDGYSATKHQREVGTGYFDSVVQTITGGQASTAAMQGSTEEEQFRGAKKALRQPKAS